MNPYVDKHTYSIQDMFDTYQDENLSMDDTLAMLIIPTALRINAAHNGNLTDETNYASWVDKVINLYNKNEQYLHTAHKINSIGELDAVNGGLL